MRRKLFSMIAMAVVFGVSSFTMAMTSVDVEVGTTAFPHPWRWTMQIDQLDDNGNPLPGGPQTVVAEGQALIRITDPSDPGFDFGPDDSPNPLLPNGARTFDTEIVSMSLVGQSDVFGGDFQITLQQPAVGQIQGLQNQRGMLVGDSFFDVFVRVDAGNMQLENEDPWRIGMAFTPEIGVPANDVRWMPFWNWVTFPPGQLPPALIDVNDATQRPWDRPVTIHTDIPGMQWRAPAVPEPATALLGGLGLMVLSVATRRRRA